MAMVDVDDISLTAQVGVSVGGRLALFYIQ